MGMKLLSILGKIRWLLTLEDTHNINQLQKFEAALNKHNYSLRNFYSILDYGCGDGRLIKYLSQFSPQANIFGCDVSSILINKCKRKYNSHNFIQTNEYPPLDFPNEKFDLIYSYSVFTVISEEVHIAWLKELSRVLKPGGVSIHAIKGHEFVRRAMLFSPEVLDSYYNLKKPIDSFIKENEGYYFSKNKVARRSWGWSMISKEYVKKHWSTYAGIEVIDIIEGAIETYPHGCHDLVLLKKTA